MPHERRCPISKARIFVPTTSERVHVQSRKQIKQDLEDVSKLKKELEAYLELLKNKI